MANNQQWFQRLTQKYLLAHFLLSIWIIRESFQLIHKQSNNTLLILFIILTHFSSSLFLNIIFNKSTILLLQLIFLISLTEFKNADILIRENNNINLLSLVSSICPYLLNRLKSIIM
jgi:hypothetical protein